MSKPKGTKQTTGYSRETLFVIEDCMKALNLTTLQREVIMADLKKGKAVPLSSLNNTRTRIRHAPTQSVFLAERPRKRRRETMIVSGAYDVPQFVPQAKVDREKEKERLQNICFGINKILDEEEESTRKHVNLSSETKTFKHERIKELENEIEDRLQFLAEVEKLGCKKKYDLEIKNEISEKLEQLKRLSNSLQPMPEQQNVS